MNATSLEELRAAQAAAEQSQSQELAPSPASYPDDTRMEQIRDLLIGDHVAENSKRMADLEARQRAFEHTVLERLDLISQRMDALSRDVQADRRAAFDELSRAMIELSNRVRGI